MIHWQKKLQEVLDDIHKTLFERAKKIHDERITQVTDWKDFIPALDNKNIVLAPWCDKTPCEDEIKIKTGPKKEEKPKDEEFEPITGAAKSLCIPFEQPPLKQDTKCFHCGETAKVWCLWGRSY